MMKLSTIQGYTGIDMILEDYTPKDVCVITHPCKDYEELCMYYNYPIFSSFKIKSIDRLVVKCSNESYLLIITIEVGDPDGKVSSKTLKMN